LLHNRLMWEEREKQIISVRGVMASQSKGRRRDESECEVRTCFQRDVDRITHSKSFRRLKHKTQVFLQPEGDHYRTRLTHTLEVTRIARTISRALMLNEDLTEAVALGHDLGHTPFGHAGERALDTIFAGEGGFRHYEQSLRVVDVLEKNGEGLNLTHEVRNGIVRHTCDPPAETLEGQVVRLADKIAYINHDLDDAVRAGILGKNDIPENVRLGLGEKNSRRIDTLVKDIIVANTDTERIALSPEAADIVDSFYNFMHKNVYTNPEAKGEEEKVLDLIDGIFEYYEKNFEKLPEEYKKIADSCGKRRAICDYISGMTDKYAVNVYSEIYIPSAWKIH
jgi:dGTPase